MSTPSKNEFKVTNQISNEGRGENNRHKVNSNYACNQVKIKCDTVNLHSSTEFGVTTLVEKKTSSTSSFVLEIVLRSGWGATEPDKALKNIEKPTQLVIIGHTVTENAEDPDVVKSICRSMQAYHKSLRFDDIGYNFMIGCDGNVYEGRGFDFVGEHTSTMNLKSIGIGFIGDFRQTSPPQASIEKCQQLIKLGVETGHIAENYQIVGQCDVMQTESPGIMLYKEIKTWTR